MNFGTYSPRNSVGEQLVSQLSTRRLVPRHPPTDLFLVLTPKSRERINNEVQGRVCPTDRRSDECPKFPLISIPKTPSLKAHLLRWWIGNEEQSKSAERFNEPLVRRRSPQTHKKLLRFPRGTLAGKTKTKMCTQTCQTEFPPDTKVWSLEEMRADAFSELRTPRLPVIPQLSWSRDSEDFD